MEEFYKEYFSKETIEEATKVKFDILKRYIKDDKIYKFIQFDGDGLLNEKKINLLYGEKLWFSYYKKLNDPSEYEIKYNLKKVASAAGVSRDSTKRLVESIKELYDVCSFSYACEKYMWENYANNGNGICLVFNVDDYDYLYPIVYLPKEKVNFTKMLIDSYKLLKYGKKGIIQNDKMALLPWILKNPNNGKYDSTKEKEVRALYCPYDKSEFNYGIIYPEVKNIKRYKGINVCYSDVGLRLDKIIISYCCDVEIKEKVIQYADGKSINVEQWNEFV